MEITADQRVTRDATEGDNLTAIRAFENNRTELARQLELGEEGKEHVLRLQQIARDLLPQYIEARLAQKGSSSFERHAI